MVENQPYAPEITSPAESGVDSRQENLSKEADDLKKLIDSKDTDEINSKLDDNFLNNLENGLHPDTAIQLKTAIEQVVGYNTEGTNLNKLYKYVVSICDAFDKDEKDNNDHESITENYNIELNNNVKRVMNEFITKNDTMNIVLQDGKLSSQLSAIKGILNGEKVSGSVIVNMAEFLGIKIKSDDRYGKNRIKRLGNKIFSTDDPNSLFKWLENKYEQVSKSDKITAFRAKPFDSGHSLNDICNFLKIGNRDGGDIDKNNQQVIQFCEALVIDSNKFAEDFSKKNTERKNTNETKLGEFDITTMLSDKKIIKKSEDDTKIYLAGGEGGEDTELTKDNFMEILSISAEAIAENLEGTSFVGNELSVAIDGKKDTWFNAIAGKAVVQETEPEPEPTPDIESLEQIDSNINLFNKLSEQDIIGAVNVAKEHLAADGVSEENKATFTERINKVIAALKEGGKPVNRSGSESIQDLQNTMNAALDSLKSRPLIEDGKLGRNTFFAIKEFLGVATEGDRLRYDVPRGRVSDGQLSDYDGFDGITDEGQRASVEAQLRNPRERLNYLVNNNNFPGQEKISKITRNGDALKDVQLQLVPYYNTNRGIIQIDGKLGARTLSALENYITENSGKSGDKIIIPDETYGYEEGGKLKCVLRNGYAYFDNFNGGNGLKYTKTNQGIEATIKEDENETRYLYQNQEPHLCHDVSGKWMVAANDKVEGYLKMIGKAQNIGAGTPATDTVPPATDTVPPATDTVPPATDTVPPTTDTVPPATDTVPPATDTVPPATDTVPPATDTVPPATDTVPPATDTVPPATDTVPPATDTVPPATDTVPPATDTVPPTTDTVPPATDTVPPATDTVPPATDTVPPATDTVDPTKPIVGDTITV